MPVYGWWPIGETDNDLTRQHAHEPQGQRIVVAGTVTDESGRPVAGALIELWQANAAGRYHHVKDDHPAPLDPNFTGARPDDHRRERPLPIHDDQARARIHGATMTTPGARRISIFRCSDRRSAHGS